jgi:hypothetical protein
VIENIKVFNLREALHDTEGKSEEELVNLNEKMMIVNENRTIISKELDAKVDQVIKGEPNAVLRVFKTYDK